MDFFYIATIICSIVISPLISTWIFPLISPRKDHRQEPSTISINGEEYSGNTISIVDGSIEIGGKKIGKSLPANIPIKIIGDSKITLYTNHSVQAETINGNVQCENLTCEDVNGNVKAEGDVTCNDIYGFTHAGRDINMKEIFSG